MPPLSQRRTSPSRTPAAGNRVAKLGSTAEISPAYKTLGGTSGLEFLPFLQTRRWVTGLRKVSGKTTLFSQQRNTAYFDFELGSRNIPMGPGSVRFPIRTYKALDDILRQIKADVQRGQCPFEHAVFDTVDRMVPLIADRLEATLDWCVKNRRSIYDYGDGKRGYSLIAAATLLFPRELALLGLGWTCIGHIKLRPTKDEDGREVEEMAAAVLPGINEGLNQDADLIWKAKSVVEKETVLVNKKTEVKYSRRYFIETITPPQESETWTTAHRGSRVPMLPLIEIPKARGIDVLEAEYEAACKREAEFWRSESAA